MASLLYNNISSFSEGLALVESDGRFGFIDRSGRVAVSFEYDYATSFSDSLALVKTNDVFA